MIIWLRHGESTWNAAGRLQGRTPHPPLTKLGVRQAEAAAHALRGLSIERIIASPAVRTRRTATAIGGHLGLPVHLDPRFVEQGLDEPAAHVEQRVAAALAELPTSVRTLVVTHGDVIALAVARATGQPHRVPANGEWVVVE